MWAAGACSNTWSSEELQQWGQALPFARGGGRRRRSIKAKSSGKQQEEVIQEGLPLKCWQPLDQLQNRKANEMQKYPPTYKTWDCPKYPFKYPLEYSKNTKFVFWGYFSGIFGVFSRSSAVGGICMSGWYFGLFWGLWGFLLCSWLVGCQLKWKILLCTTSHFTKTIPWTEKENPWKIRRGAF